jgi:hypothetical protein
LDMKTGCEPSATSKTGHKSPVVNPANKARNNARTANNKRNNARANKRHKADHSQSHLPWADVVQKPMMATSKG